MEDVYVKMNKYLWCGWMNREKQWSTGPIRMGKAIFKKPGKPCVKALDWERVGLVSIPISALILLPEFEQVPKSFSASVHNEVIIFSWLTVGHCYPEIVLMGAIEQSTVY